MVLPTVDFLTVVLLTDVTGVAVVCADVLEDVVAVVGFDVVGADEFSVFDS